MDGEDATRQGQRGPNQVYCASHFYIFHVNVQTTKGPVRVYYVDDLEILVAQQRG